MEYVISFLLLFMEIVSLKNIISTFFNEKFNNKIQYKTYIFLSTLLSFVLKISFLEQIIILKYIFVIIIFAWVFKFTYQISIIKSLTISMLWYCISVATEFISSQIYFKLFSLSQEEFLKSYFHFIFASIGSRAILISITALFKKWYTAHYNNDGMSIKEYAMIALYPLATTIMILVSLVPSIETDTVSVFQLSTLLLIILANIVVFYLMGNINTEKRKNKENAVLQEKIKSEHREKVLLQDSYKKQRSMTHDFNNNLVTIKNILEEINDSSTGIDVLKKYVNSLVHNTEKYMAVIRSNNVLIDAILNQKYQEALNKGIVTSYEITDLSKINIAEADIVAILTNAIDNAITAAEKSKDKKIKIILSNIEGEFIFRIRNTVDKKVNIYNNTIETSKEDKINSGYGINNIKASLSNYNSVFEISSTETEFILSALVY